VSSSQSENTTGHLDVSPLAIKTKWMIPYPGGKSRLAGTICSFAPPSGGTYCEPFAGRGNVFWTAAGLLTYRRWWLNDTRTAPFLQAIRRLGDKIDVPYRTRNDGCGTKELYKRYRDEDSDEALLLEPFLTYSGSGYHSGGPRGDGAGAGSARYTRVLRECHRIMHAVRPTVTNWDWEKVVARLGPGDFALVDPPYLNSNTRTYSEDDLDHERLAWVLKRAKFRWILCQYLHPVYLSGLGDPFWSKDMDLFVSSAHETRTECMWSNFPVPRSSETGIAGSGLTVGTRSKLRCFTEAASLSFSDLDTTIDQGLERVARDWTALVPYLLEMNRRLSAPGKRADLRQGAPINLTWTQWVESKRSKLGRSLRTIQYMLRGRTEASKARKTLAQCRAELRQKPSLQIPDTPMEISVMARLILEMRDRSRNVRRTKHLLEVLAERFLRLTEQTIINQHPVKPQFLC
jgi:site-specific DNA-adenine methylase